MSLPYTDVRCKLRIDHDAVLEAIAEDQGREKSVIVRELIETFIDKRLKFPRLVHSKLDEIGMVSVLGECGPVTGKK